MSTKNILSNKNNFSKGKGGLGTILAGLGLVGALNAQAQDLPQYDGNVGLSDHDKNIVDSLTQDKVRAYRFDPSLVDFVHQTEQEIASTMVLSQLNTADLHVQDSLYENYTKLLDNLYNGHKSMEALKDALLTKENMLSVLKRWSEDFVTLETDGEKKESFDKMFYIVGRYAYETSYAGGSYDGQGMFHVKTDNILYDDAQVIVHRADEEKRATQDKSLMDEVYDATDPQKVFELMKQYLNQKESLKYYLTLPVQNVLDAVKDRGVDEIYNSSVKLATILHRAGDIDEYLSENDRMNLMQKLRSTLPLFVEGDQNDEKLLYIENILRDLGNPQDAFGSEFDGGEIDGRGFSDLEGAIIDASFSEDYSYLKNMGTFRRIEYKHKDIVDHLTHYEDEKFDISGLYVVDNKVFGSVCDAIRKNDNITTVVINPSLIMTTAQLRDMESAPSVMEAYLKNIAKIFVDGKHIKLVGDYSGLGQDYDRVKDHPDGTAEPLRENNKAYEYFISSLLDMVRDGRDTEITYEVDVLGEGELSPMMNYGGKLHLPYLVDRSPSLSQTEQLLGQWVAAHPDGGEMELGVTRLSNEHLRAIITAIRDQSRDHSVDDPKNYKINFSRLEANPELTHIAGLAAKYVTITFGTQ